MTEKKEPIVLNQDELYEINGTLYSLREIEAFIDSAKELGRKTRFIKALRLSNQQLTEERNKLADEITRITSMGMFEFGNTYGTEESLSNDGKAFAKALLGGA